MSGIFAAIRATKAAGLGDGLRRDLLERADAVGVPISPAERRELQGSCLDGGRVRLWRCPVPLTLLDTVYDPVGQVMPPTAAGGVVLWLRPSLEERYLHLLTVTRFADEGFVGNDDAESGFHRLGDGLVGALTR